MPRWGVCTCELICAYIYACMCASKSMCLSASENLHLTSHCKAYKKPTQANLSTGELITRNWEQLTATDKSVSFHTLSDSTFWLDQTIPIIDSHSPLEQDIWPRLCQLAFHLQKFGTQAYELVNCWWYNQEDMSQSHVSVFELCT